ncbi:hypothetical protein PG985_008696 [Apiospora marii]|uniref:uncharacterized protein n=1 Tax=Apiospora marii TaxID=335849 RepID=UPI003130C333
MPIRDGSPPAPARSRDDSEEEDDDDDHVHKTARANGKRLAGDGSKSDPDSSHGGDAIPPLSCWAPAMFVPAKFDYTQPQQSAQEQEQLPPHQRLNNLLADLDAHAAAVRANHAWMVGREARRIQQDTVREEARIIGMGESLPRSKRLPPSDAEEAALIRNMAAVPAELQQQPQRRQSNPNTIPAFRRSSYNRNNNSNNATGGAASDPAATVNILPPTEVSMNFSYRDVSALTADKRDTLREAAVTSVLNVARNAMHSADWYSSVCLKRRNDKIRDHANEKAKSFAQQDTTGPSGNQNTNKSMTSSSSSSSAAMTESASTSTNTSGGLPRRVSFGGLDGTADDGGDMPMDLDL